MYFKIKTIDLSLNSNDIFLRKMVNKIFQTENSKVKSASPHKKSIVSVIRTRYLLVSGRSF